jgi:prophage maintenance system killer protein
LSVLYSNWIRSCFYAFLLCNKNEMHIFMTVPLFSVQLRQTFDQKDLYPDIVTKAAALRFSLVMDHPFVDGKEKKRVTS